MPLETCEFQFVHEDTVRRALALMPRKISSTIWPSFSRYSAIPRASKSYALFEAEMCVCDIAQLLNMTSTAVSHQLRILKGNKLVKSRRGGQEHLPTRSPTAT